MDFREVLVELLYYKADFISMKKAKYLADHLIANGVIMQKHGRWEPHPHAYGYERCSVCNDCNIWGEWADGKKWNYCPNCGAKMDKEGIE